MRKWTGRTADRPPPRRRPRLGQQGRGREGASSLPELAGPDSALSGWEGVSLVLGLRPGWGCSAAGGPRAGCPSLRIRDSALSHS